MAKPATALNNGENDLLVAILKHTNGVIDFQAVADELEITTAGAAGKRVKRLVDKIAPGEAILVGCNLGSGSSGPSAKGGRGSSTEESKVPETPKAPTTPRSRNKRKTKDSDDIDDSPDHQDGVIADPGSPTKSATEPEVNGKETPSTKKKAKTSKTTSTKSTKSPRATKAKSTKSPKKAKVAVSDAIIIDDNEAAANATFATNKDTVAPQKANGTQGANDDSVALQTPPADPVEKEDLTDQDVKSETVSDASKVMINGETKGSKIVKEETNVSLGTTDDTKEAMEVKTG